MDFGIAEDFTSNFCGGDPGFKFIRGKVGGAIIFFCLLFFPALLTGALFLFLGL
jgi:hypothetical protein